VKLHALPISPPPPPPPPARPSTQTAAVAVALPFQQQAVGAIQATPIRRTPAETRGNTAAQAKASAASQAAATVQATLKGNAAAELPYRRGALLDISA
jgi:hypothetical protein